MDSHAELSSSTTRKRPTHSDIKKCTGCTDIVGTSKDMTLRLAGKSTIRPRSKLFKRSVESLKLLDVKSPTTTAGKLTKCPAAKSSTSPASKFSAGSLSTRTGNPPARSKKSAVGNKSSSGELACVRRIPSSDVQTIPSKSVLASTCAWSPTVDCLATGSTDSTVRLWSVSNSINGMYCEERLKHCPNWLLRLDKDVILCGSVSSLHWGDSGRWFAIGSSDGYANVWERDVMRKVYGSAEEPVTVVRFSKSRTKISTGTSKGNNLVWQLDDDYTAWYYQLHKGSVVDVDWRCDNTFASCSVDTTVKVCSTNSERAMKTFDSHTGVVKSVKWDPQGSLLASCSADSTVKIWSLEHDTCIYDFTDHTKEVNSISWSPTGPGTNYPNATVSLASGSSDSTVRIYDVQRGVCVNKMEKHSFAVYSVAFAPDGALLASGGSDKNVFIWSAQSRKAVSKFRGASRITKVDWNHRGDKLAAVDIDGNVYIIDLRMQRQIIRCAYLALAGGPKLRVGPKKNIKFF